MRLRDDDRGSVLILVPAGFLVLILLAALAVDSAVGYLGQRQLHDALAAGANDSVTAGISSRQFYGHGTVTLDPTLVEQAACASVAAQNVSGLSDIHLYIAIDGPSVRLVGTAVVSNVFGRALPGVGRRTVRASAAAVVTNGTVFAAAGSGPSSLIPVTCG